jgi:hypothetical protein
MTGRGFDWASTGRWNPEDRDRFCRQVLDAFPGTVELGQPGFEPLRGEKYLLPEGKPAKPLPLRKPKQPEPPEPQLSFADWAEYMGVGASAGYCVCERPLCADARVDGAWKVSECRRCGGEVIVGGARTR